jgi:peptidoglycan/xylan/chitin deacetylase (PgdA/CDA1 family)
MNTGVLWQSALQMASGRGRRARLSVLVFHRVRSRPDPLFPGEADAASFDMLMRHVRSRFHVLPLVSAVRALASETLPPRALAITFDDGYADNLTIAAPILARHGLPATVFIATGYLDGGCMFNDVVIDAVRCTRAKVLDLRDLGLGVHPTDTHAERRQAIDAVLGTIKYRPPSERHRLAEETARAAAVPLPPSPMLTRQGVRELAAAGIEIGAHTVSHPILNEVPASVAREEIGGSKQALETITDRSVRLFAYPNGVPGRDFGDEHVRMVREAGYAAAVTTAPGTARATTDPFQLPRFTPWSRDPLKFDLLMIRNLRVAARAVQ